jgi:ComF family protein
MRALRELGSGLLDLLMPPACAGCGAATRGALCPGCRQDLPWIRSGVCDGCQRQASLPGGDRCLACALRPSPLDACLAACWFEASAAAWVRDYKYAAGGGPFAGTELARMRALALALGRRAPSALPDRIVPVPLHPSRLRARGFNPAAGVARVLARECGARCAYGLLQRSRATRSQTGLGRSGRVRNVRGAFRATGPTPPSVWLVDDVVTTGATLEAAARALRRRGTRRVVGLCLARTPLSAASPPSPR